MRLFVIIILTICLNYEGAAQKHDAALIMKTTRLMKQVDSLQRSDSLRRLALQKEIDQLRGASTNKQRLLLVEKLKKIATNDSLRRQLQWKHLQTLKNSNTGTPVAPFFDTLFTIYTPIGSFSTRDRATAITSKIRKLYNLYDFNQDSLTINVTETSPEIIYNDVMVMSVNELEALWYNRKPNELALDYRNKIRMAIQKEREANTLKNIVLRVSSMLLILVGISIIIILINKLFKKIRVRLTNLKDTILKGIRIRRYKVLDSRRQLQLILFVLNGIRLIIIVLTIYFTLPLLFSIFPWTSNIADMLIGWIVNPMKSMFSSLINYLPNFFTILVIAFVTHYFIRLLKFMANEIEIGRLKLPGFYSDWARPTLNLVKFLVYVFSFIIIFPYLPGSNSPIFQGVSVFVGILFSFGSSSAISNAVAGLVITYMRPFKIGDRVKIGEVTGDVIDKSLLVTRLRTIKNEDITIPNASILSGHVINYTTSAKELGLILHTGVTIGYDAPWKKVHELLISAALATNGIMQDAKKLPFVIQTSLDDFYVSYQLNAFTDEPHRMSMIYSELHQNIQDKFNEGGVEILSPHYRAARDGNATTIPSDYLKEGYKAPSFHVSMENTPTDKE